MNKASRHRVAVIGGDGIGPEVCAEALKVVAASGVDLDTTEFELIRSVLQTTLSEVSAAL